MLSRTSSTRHEAVGDIDGDGCLEDHMGNMTGGDIGPRFYLNSGKGVFSEAVDRLPANTARRTVGRTYTAACLLDLDGDGRPDRVASVVTDSADGNRIKSFLNRGADEFVDPTEAMQASIGGIVFVHAADFDCDGRSTALKNTFAGVDAVALSPDK